MNTSAVASEKNIFISTCYQPNMPGNLPLCTHRYGLFVSYIGTKYNGSQRLSGRDEVNSQGTVQEALEWSLENFLPRKRCRLTAASRTDKGVHALMNCFTLPLMDFDMPTERFKLLANENLIRKKHDIVINECLLVPNTFHARKSVISREYIYRIAVAKNSRLTKLIKTSKPNELVHLLPASELYRTLPIHNLNLDKVEESIDLLRGEHDFASFTFKPTDPEDTVRNLEIQVTKESQPAIGLSGHQPHFPFDLYQFHFKSRSFLHNQIRRVMGTILGYASFQNIELSEIEKLLTKPSSMSWTSRFHVAEPWGLYLSRLIFDQKLGAIDEEEPEYGLVD